MIKRLLIPAKYELWKMPAKRRHLIVLVKSQMVQPPIFTGLLKLTPQISLSHIIKGVRLNFSRVRHILAVAQDYNVICRVLQGHREPGLCSKDYGLLAMLHGLH
jgi:hypothetical protein